MILSKRSFHCKYRKQGIKKDHQEEERLLFLYVRNRAIENEDIWKMGPGHLSAGTISALYLLELYLTRNNFLSFINLGL
jgi:hypothetical protein